jgi:2-polyprenyl-3-methyl-5-hydroxy-6-metoxy-1,4-benzoquinol methylase
MKFTSEIDISSTRAKQRSCPVCCSKYVTYFQDVIGNRTRNFFKQYFCMDCNSFFHKSGYSEDLFQQKSDFEELLSQRENHEAIMSQLVLELMTKVPYCKTMLEIGFGTGYLMKAGMNYGLSVYGFEVNKYCVEYAQHDLELNCEKGLFSSEHPNKYVLIVANQVFEHLENPRDLLITMISKLNPDGCIYISVPFVERNMWHFLESAGSTPSATPPDPFYDNDVHITHFSRKGMELMGSSLGARSSEFWISTDVFYHSPGSYHGVLFRF